MSTENSHQADSDKDGAGDVCDFAFDYTQPAPGSARPEHQDFRVLSALYHFPENSPRKSRSDVFNALEGEGDQPSAASILANLSRGALTLNATATNPRPFPKTKAEYESSGDIKFAAANDAFSDLDENTDLRDFDVVVLFLEPNRDSSGFSIERFGASATRYATSDKAGGDIPVVILDAEYDLIPINVLTHELGHTLGLRHVSALTCGSATQITGSEIASWTELERMSTIASCAEGSPFVDVYQSGFVMGANSGRLMAAERVGLGWLESEKVATVNPGETRTITLQANPQEPGFNAIQIPVGSDVGGGDYALWVNAFDHYGFNVLTHHESLAGAGPEGAIRQGDAIAADGEPLAGIVSVEKGLFLRGDEGNFYGSSVFVPKSGEGEVALRPGREYHDVFRGVLIEGLSEDAERSLITYRVSRSGLNTLGGELVVINGNAAESIRLRNGSNVAISLSQPQLEGNDPAFTFSPGNCGGSLPAGGECVMTVSVSGRGFNEGQDGRGYVASSIRATTSDTLRPHLVIEVVSAI